MGSLGKKTLVLTKSEEIFNEAKNLMPGGVNSPVRAFKSVGGQPIVIDSAKGARMYDVDGNVYIDYLASWGLTLIGHADDKVLAAIGETMQKGTTFGAPNPLENVLAKMVIDALPSVEMIRFVNSGTEACMSALRLARTFTGRQKVIKFDGCYHGHADPFLVNAGSGIATLGLRELKNPAASDTIICSFNDVEGIESIFEKYKGEVAALILEPLVGNSGYVEAKPGYLNFLRQITKDNGSLLIFDEVKTGFRLSYGGAQKYYGINPDLTTLGKIVGGGLPVGAYGGRRDIMELVAPSGPMYQAGTLCGNPIAMIAGIKTLERLQEPGTYEYLEKITNELVTGILEAARKAGHDIVGGYTSGMWGFFFSKEPVYCMADAKNSDTKKFARFWKGMIEEGVYLPPTPFEAGFTSLAHTPEDIRLTIEAAERVFQQI